MVRVLLAAGANKEGNLLSARPAILSKKPEACDLSMIPPKKRTSRPSRNQINVVRRPVVVVTPNVSLAERPQCLLERCRNKHKLMLGHQVDVGTTAPDDCFYRGAEYGTLSTFYDSFTDPTSFSVFIQDER